MEEKCDSDQNVEVSSPGLDLSVQYYKRDLVKKNRSPRRPATCYISNEVNLTDIQYEQIKQSQTTDDADARRVPAQAAIRPRSPMLGGPRMPMLPIGQLKDVLRQKGPAGSLAQKERCLSMPASSSSSGSPQPLAFQLRKAQDKPRELAPTAIKTEQKTSFSYSRRTDSKEESSKPALQSGIALKSSIQTKPAFESITKEPATQKASDSPKPTVGRVAELIKSSKGGAKIDKKPSIDKPDDESQKQKVTSGYTAKITEKFQSTSASAQTDNIKAGWAAKTEPSKITPSGPIESKPTSAFQKAQDKPTTSLVKNSPFAQAQQTGATTTPAFGSKDKFQRNDNITVDIGIKKPGNVSNAMKAFETKKETQKSDITTNQGQPLAKDAAGGGVKSSNFYNNPFIQKNSSESQSSKQPVSSVSAGKDKPPVITTTTAENVSDLKIKIGGEDSAETMKPSIENPETLKDRGDTTLDTGKLSTANTKRRGTWYAGKAVPTITMPTATGVSKGKVSDFRTMKSNRHNSEEKESTSCLYRDIRSNLRKVGGPTTLQKSNNNSVPDIYLSTIKKLKPVSPGL